MTEKRKIASLKNACIRLERENKALAQRVSNINAEVKKLKKISINSAFK
ncbi:MAG: hypothetical protein KKB81_03155 [Candidatus Margulisbacteria bacterium]|nr:hypothetical protein [Candidatus Margulisiibacteriota bacterium]MBU1022243.1 hypothetical protein [Candidatus Margulisiibacteriota bacterium]MBU1729318.1 hypothetical protein [Candidatus Margulisiibacteriota bacterium]MBU1955591.1 hypothetical protein [Candidatus Margulisiibacteriota bacterium]